MPDVHQAKLESLGLTAGEAQVYLALLRSGGTLGATALATATGLPRTGVYPLLNSLVQKGIVEAEAGYGSRFTAIHPTQALPALVSREREKQQEQLLHRERMAADLVEELDAVAEPNPVSGDSAEVIQVLRDPRVITARFERLQNETERQIEVCVKAPFFMGPVANTAQENALRRGVRARALYERAVLDAPEVRPYLEGWVAKGEQARIYDGELPHKLALFDRRSVLLPLFMPGDQVRTLFIRHQPLATSLGMLFDTLWQNAEPIRPSTNGAAKSTRRPAEAARRS
jgi:HTH-type transcriptional regulator, sugar sensing transcriptional regulator